MAKLGVVHMVLDENKFVCGIKKGNFDSVIANVTCGRCLKLSAKGERTKPVLVPDVGRETMPDVAPVEELEDPLQENEEVVGTRIDCCSGKKMKVAKQVKKVEIKKKAEPEKKPVTVPAKKKKTKDPKVCLCGCKGMTKGGTFIPGHDARYYSAMKKAGTPVPHGKHK